MKKIVYLILIAFLFSACSEEWLDVKPSDALTPENAFKNVNDAQVALNGVYGNLFTAGNRSTYYGADIITYGDVKGDDVRIFDAAARTSIQYQFQEVPENGSYGLWRIPFRGLMNVNAIISKIDDLDVLTDDEKSLQQDIKGQSLALRALMHFDLVRIFGKMPFGNNPNMDLGVPIVTRIIAPDEKLARNTVKEVYDQVISDLQAAMPLLSEDVNIDGKINKWAAKALLARVYLYNGDNSNAFIMAKDVIDNGPYSLVTKEMYSQYWSTGGGSETLFEIVMTEGENSDREGIGYLWDPKGYGAITLTDGLVNLLSENPLDIRSSIIGVDSRDNRLAYLKKYPGKDGASTRINNIKVIRLAEMYLIAAEAAVKIVAGSADAKFYLETLIRARTGDSSFSIPNGDVSLDRVMIERRKEFVGEGHRFFDLMRNGYSLHRIQADHPIANLISMEPSDYRVVQPIPKEETDVNSKLIQNAGYISGE